MSQNPEYDIVIVGAGIAGLLAAHRLQESGRRVLLVEKSRGLGGRMATRYREKARFDHGAQYFSAQSPEFQAIVEQWRELGLVTPWFYGLEHPDDPQKGHPRYVCPTGMNRIGKHLAEGLEIRCKTRIERTHTGGTWKLVTDTGETLLAPWLLLTAPVPQSLELLADSAERLPPGDLAALRAVSYDPCLCAMLSFHGEGGVPGFGGVAPDHKDIHWVADNRKKGVSEAPSVTVHSSGTFAHTYWDSPDHIRAPLLVEAARPYFTGSVADVSVHRWKFSLVLQGYPDSCYFAPDLRLALAGDAFGGAKIEGAALSGLAAAQAIREATTS